MSIHYQLMILNVWIHVFSFTSHFHKNVEGILMQIFFNWWLLVMLGMQGNADQDKESGRNWVVDVSVHAYYSSILVTTCDCVNPGVPYRLCLVSVKRARSWTQGLSSGHLTRSQIGGAQLAPHAWLAHDPEGRDPCLGHVQSCDPLTNWWKYDSHVYEVASTSPSNNSFSVCSVNL